MAVEVTVPHHVAPVRSALLFQKAVDLVLRLITRRDPVCKTRVEIREVREPSQKLRSRLRLFQQFQEPLTPAGAMKARICPTSCGDADQCERVMTADHSHFSDSYI